MVELNGWYKYILDINKTKRDMPIEKETEEKIFLAAQKVFQRKGYTGARMQEIADEAKINKSMLHYYYRSKEKLFLAVFRSSVKKIMPELFSILSMDVPLKEKVTRIVDFYHSVFKKNPHLPAFVIYEMNQNPGRFKDFISSMGIRIPQKFLEQIQDEISAGRLKKISPHQFLMNIVAMCMMPLVARNMVQSLFRMGDDEYFAFLEERRELIPEIIFSGVMI
ncbi:MAG: TetR/AcrR family transcriptional regulator [Balneolaceae bacterium]